MSGGRAGEFAAEKRGKRGEDELGIRPGGGCLGGNAVLTPSKTRAGLGGCRARPPRVCPRFSAAKLSRATTLILADRRGPDGDSLRRFWPRSHSHRPLAPEATER